MSESQDTVDSSLFRRAPTEIKTSILELLDFSDIKSLRLVNKAFSPACNDILFRHVRLLLIAERYAAPLIVQGIWPTPTIKPSVTIKKFEAFTSFRQRNLFCHVQNLEILAYSPDAVRGQDGNVTIEHRRGVFVSRLGVQGYARPIYTETSINDLVNALNSMTRLTSLYMHMDFLKHLEDGQLSLNFLANRVKSFKIIAKVDNGILPSARFFSNLVTLEAHPVLLLKAGEHGLVNLPNLKSLIVYGGRGKYSGWNIRRGFMSPPENPPFDINEFLAAQESPFSLTSLSLKTLEQNLSQNMIAFPEKINPTLISPYLSNLRRLHIDFDHSDFNNMDSDHIWNVFKVNNIHLEDVSLGHVSKQLISYLGSYRDTLKSVQLKIQVRHPLHGMSTPMNVWVMRQDLGAVFWRDVVPAHSSTLHTLRTKPTHNPYQELRDWMQSRPLEPYLPDLWSPVNNPAAQQAIEKCERLRELAVFAIDNENQPFEQVIWLMLRQPKLRRFTFYNNYTTEWVHTEELKSNEFYLAANKLLRDALDWSGSNEIEINGGFRLQNPLEIELYPAGKLKTYFDWNRQAWMLAQVKFDREQPKEEQMELELDEGEVERILRTSSRAAGWVCACGPRE
ncbi:hypothetical protein TWF506_007236 [Arthrobotrys conoides]|uniref:F-box domain-containing protein n=1 Tax=Arthrobotrys conoides TaxID=74498 RepID=A0AAN8RSL8_9PEZI